MFGKQKVAMIVAEFFGTAVLASVALAVLEIRGFPLFFLGIAMAAVYGVFWLMLGRTSSAQLNPVVTVGLWTLRKIQTTQAIVLIAAQGLGGLVAWRLNEYLLHTTLTKITGKQFDWRVLIAEALGTLILGMGVAAALYNETDDLTKALTIAGSVFLGVNVASFASNGLLNPAVELGVRSLSWSYGIGALVGGVAGINLYAWLFAPAGAVARAAVTTSSAKVVTTTTKKKVSSRKKVVAKKPATRKRK